MIEDPAVMIREPWIHARVVWMIDQKDSSSEGLVDTIACCHKMTHKLAIVARVLKARFPEDRRDRIHDNQR